MESALTPREIQSRIRGGATLAEVAAAAGVDESRILGFARPVLAEREHIALTALGCAIRRRGDGAGHRRLRELLTSRLQARSIDADEIEWDAWREADLKWRVVGTLESLSRTAEFVFDPRGRFSVADNGDARWMIGEELPGATDPDNENTVDFDDEFALVRATAPAQEPPAIPGDDVPTDSFDEGPATSELDDLYDMLSGVSEDSVRIYVGLEGEDSNGQEDDDPPALSHSGALALEQPEFEAPENQDDEDTRDVSGERSLSAPPRSEESVQQTLLGETEPQPQAKKKGRRAHVPSWDEIMFGSPR